MTTGTLTPLDEKNGETVVAPATWNFDATHRCDRCGAQAYIKATHADYENGLLFCNHHGNKVMIAGTRIPVIKHLESKGWTISDKSNRLYESTKPDGGSAAG